MYNVFPDLLWIGHSRDAHDGRAAVSAGIEAVVDVAYEEVPAHLPRDVVYCRFPILDGGGNDPRVLRVAIETIAGLIDAGVPTLVACSNAMSRSPSLAAAALATHRGQSLDEALKTLAQTRPHDVSTALWEDVIKACGA